MSAWAATLNPSIGMESDQRFAGIGDPPVVSEPESRGSPPARQTPLRLDARRSLSVFEEARRHSPSPRTITVMGPRPQGSGRVSTGDIQGRRTPSTGLREAFRMLGPR